MSYHLLKQISDLIVATTDCESAPEGCGDGYWDCGDGQCIPESYVCDGSIEFCNASWGPDCDNGADEGLESCDYVDECEDSADTGGDDGCVNDDSTTDSWGDSCSSWYDANEGPGSAGCTGAYDDDDFVAAEQCCVCQGDARESVNENIFQMQFSCDRDMNEKMHFEAIVHLQKNLLKVMRK